MVYGAVLGCILGFSKLDFQTFLFTLSLFAACLIVADMVVQKRFIAGGASSYVFYRQYHHSRGSYTSFTWLWYLVLSVLKTVGSGAAAFILVRYLSGRGGVL